MSPLLRRIFTQGLATLAVAGLVIVGIIYVQNFVRVDPFAGIRKPNSELGERIGIRLDGVSLRHYRGSKLLVSAQIDRVDVTKDRSHFDLYGIHDGVYRGDESDVQFASDRGVWNDSMRRLDVGAGAHIKSKDFDLIASAMQFNSRTSILSVAEQVKGRLGKGNVNGSNLLYNLHDRSYELGPVEWTGMVALNLQGDDSDKPREWHVTGKHVSKRGDDDVFTDGIADGGDIILKAPLVVRNRVTDIVTATGNVQYFSKKANMTCSKAVIYKNEHRAILTGNVHMLIKPKDQQAKAEVSELPPFTPVVPESIANSRPPAPQNDVDKKREDELRSSESLRKYPTVVIADRIDDYYKNGNRHAEITGSPQAHQILDGGGWRHMWTHHAYYDGEKDTLKLFSTGNNRETRMRNSIGDDFTFDWAVASTKEDDDSFDAENPKGKFWTNPDQSGTTPPPTVVKPPDKKGGGGGNGGSLQGRIRGGR